MVDAVRLSVCLSQYVTSQPFNICASVRLSVCHTDVLCHNNRAHHQAISTGLYHGHKPLVEPFIRALMP